MNAHRAMILVATGLMVAACSGGSIASTTTTAVPSATAAPTTTTTTVPSTVGPAPAPTTTVPLPSTTETPSAGKVIEVMVDGSGVVTGGGRVAVELGDEVTLSVTSAVADEVHVHGFDLYLDLEPGITGQLTFLADVPGVFEIELEQSRVVLVDLEVGG